MTITIGTTPVNLLLLLRGTTYTGAAILSGYSANSNQRPNCGQLNIKSDPANTGTVAWGEDSGVTVNNCSDTILGGEQFQFNPGQGKNNVSLAKWLVATAATQKLHISIQYD